MSMIGKTLAHYEITSGLGKGGMGEVYQAKDRKLGHEGVQNLYQQPASGAKEEKLLLKSNEYKYPTSCSRDGRFLLYAAVDQKPKNDLWILPLEGDRTPVPFQRTEFNESDGHFSPDMRWIAYVSDESGSNEIYVRGFLRASVEASSAAGGKWQVSNGGGTGPRWRGDGKELYYRTPDGKVMAVTVAGDAVFQAETPRILFQAPFDIAPLTTIAPYPAWDVAADGNRFLLPAPVAESSPSPFTIILNWASLLKK